MSLKQEERERYRRHLALPEIGLAGQERLRDSSVLVIGAGGLGSPAAFYLAAAGVGRIGLMDADRVELSNLQRQILHTTESIGQQKVDSARSRLLALDPSLTIDRHPFRLDEGPDAAITGSYAVVIDATDSHASKFSIARACHRSATPYVHGGITAYTGQVMSVIPAKTACPACIFTMAPENAADPAGPLGALPGIIGSIQAAEALKLLLGLGSPLLDTLLSCSVLTMEFRRIKLTRDPGCPICG